jgi:23S rRNA-/tRNA-specific pseudouridylate synthase
MIEIELKELTKVSLNKWYSGEHWSKRKRLKDEYKIMVNSQFKGVISALKTYEVDYIFEFKSRPLDASNCVAMLKLIEDIIFEDDNYKIIKKISISSRKGVEDIVLINVKEL